MLCRNLCKYCHDFKVRKVSFLNGIIKLYCICTQLYFLRILSLQGLETGVRDTKDIATERFKEFSKAI